MLTRVDNQMLIDAFRLQGGSSEQGVYLDELLVELMLSVSLAEALAGIAEGLVSGVLENHKFLITLGR